MKAVVWEPVTGSQCCIPFPLEAMFYRPHNILEGSVLSAASDFGEGYVHNDHGLSPFKLVLLFDNVDENLLCARVYDSESGKWSNISSKTLPTSNFYISNPAVLVRNALYWFCTWRGADVLEFDLGTHSLAIIQKPRDVHFTDGSFQLLQTEDRGLCLAVGSALSIHLWGRNANSNGVLEWVLCKTVELDTLLSLRPYHTKIMGFDEDSSMIFLHTARFIFTIHLDSLQFKKVLELVEDSPVSRFSHVHAYRSFYTAGKTLKLIHMEA